MECRELTNLKHYFAQREGSPCLKGTARSFEPLTISSRVGTQSGVPAVTADCTAKAQFQMEYLCTLVVIYLFSAEGACLIPTRGSKLSTTRILPLGR